MPIQAEESFLILTYCCMKILCKIQQTLIEAMHHFLQFIKFWILTFQGQGVSAKHSPESTSTDISHSGRQAGSNDTEG